MFTSQQNSLLAKGETVHVVCDEHMKKQNLPEAYAAALKTMLKEA